MPRVRTSGMAESGKSPNFASSSDLAHVILTRALGEICKIGAVLIFLKDRQQPALRRRDLARYRVVVRRDEFCRARLPIEPRAAFPRVVIGFAPAVRELLRDLIYSLSRTCMAGHPLIQI